jgi:predicted MFS family arabinose efflux permease
MMPLSLFGSRSFVGLTLLTLLLYAALGGLFVLVPYVLIQADGYTATQAGAALLPLPLVIAVASPAAGALAARVGPRWMLVAGPIIVAAGLLLTLRIGSATSYWLAVFPAMVVIALGMAGAVAPLTTAVLMSVDSRHTGAASGLNSAVARTGGLIATALIGPVIASSGPALLSAFGVAAAIGAIICALAAASAFMLIGSAPAADAPG